MPRGQLNDQIAMTRSPPTLAITIRPPFGARECDDGALDIAESRVSTAISSTPSDGATACTARELAAYRRRRAGSRSTPRVTRRRHLFEQREPFRGEAEFEQRKPVALPPGRTRLVTKPAPPGPSTWTNTIGTVRVACSNGAVTLSR